MQMVAYLFYVQGFKKDLLINWSEFQAPAPKIKVSSLVMSWGLFHLILQSVDIIILF